VPDVFGSVASRTLADVMSVQDLMSQRHAAYIAAKAQNFTPGKALMRFREANREYTKAKKQDELAN
jgi:hypothetical protein